VIDVERVTSFRSVLGESPVWSVTEQALYWTDIREPAVHRLDPSSGATTRYDAEGFAGAVGLRRAGGLVAALGHGIYHLDMAASSVSPIANLQDTDPDLRFNDGRCDPAGRFLCGTMNDRTREPVGTLWSIEPNGAMRSLLNGLRIPNGLCWSLDSRRMYFADTLSDLIWSYEYDLAEGRLGQARLLFDAQGIGGHPDGATIDADDCMWVAMHGGAQVIRITPDGRLDRTIQLPVSQPTSCSFGGAGLDCLYVTTAAQRLSPHELEAQPLAGNVLAFRPGCRGVEEPVFGDRAQ
jgi:sugar lactone lactonase YvrE